MELTKENLYSWLDAKPATETIQNPFEDYLNHIGIYEPVITDMRIFYRNQELVTCINIPPWFDRARSRFKEIQEIRDTTVSDVLYSLGRGKIETLLNPPVKDVKKKETKVKSKARLRKQISEIIEGAISQSNSNG